MAASAAERQMVGPGTPYATLEDKWSKDISKNFRNIVVYDFERVQVYLHVDTLRIPKPEGHIKFHKFDYSAGHIDGGDFKYTVLVDTHICTAEITAKTMIALDVAREVSRKLSPQMIFVRPSLYQEMLDINTILYDEDPGRMGRLKVIGLCFTYPGDDEESYDVYEYALKQNPSDFIPDHQIMLQHIGLRRHREAAPAATTRSILDAGEPTSAVGDKMKKKGNKKKGGKH